MLIEEEILRNVKFNEDVVSWKKRKTITREKKSNIKKSKFLKSEIQINR